MDDLFIFSSENLVGIHPPWRGSLLPLGCEAAPSPTSQFPQTLRNARFTTAAPPNGGKPPRHNDCVASYTPVAAPKTDAYIRPVADIVGDRVSQP
ncbi:hypothetical protein C1884_09665 [Pseudomonas sp. GW460-R15]|nr:hypothetical protein C1887_12020 [Pseudomonas sp. GW456-R21]POA68601.1 hypothetical protein C1884_09665 [Pseudomonas sp. GW460-R15]